MQDSQLSDILTRIGEYELRIDISRQILAQNMNFSPLWLLQYLQKQTKANKTGQNNFLTAQTFQTFFNKIQLKSTKSDLLAIFQYVGKEGYERIKNNQFVQFLLPKNRDSLKKIALSRSVQELEMTISLKYCLRRLFIQVLQATPIMGQYEKIQRDFVKLNSLSQFQRLRNFMHTNQKYPTQKQLLLISEFILSKQQCKQVQNNQEKNQIQVQLKKSIKNQSQQNQMIYSNLYNEKISNEKPLNNYELRKKTILNRNQKLQQKQNDSLKSSNNITNDLKPKNKTQAKLQQRSEFSKSEFKKLQKGFIPKLKIQRTDSIINVQQKDLSSRQTSAQRDDLKKAALIAQKLLQSQCTTSRATSSDQIERSNISQTQRIPGIRYPSKRRSSQQLKESVVTLNPCSLSQVRQFRENGTILDSCQ